MSVAEHSPPPSRRLPTAPATKLSGKAVRGFSLSTHHPAGIGTQRTQRCCPRYDSRGRYVSGPGHTPARLAPLGHRLVPAGASLVPLDVGQESEVRSQKISPCDLGGPPLTGGAHIVFYVCAPFGRQRNTPRGGDTGKQCRCNPAIIFLRVLRASQAFNTERTEHLSDLRVESFLTQRTPRRDQREEGPGDGKPSPYNL
jgi:hypothetical protein